MATQSFKALHINATESDLAGNDGIGRYLFLPGSEGRAKEISTYFDNLTVKSHPRGHHLYLGTLPSQGRNIDVATIASGMGCPSMEIILHELFHLGGKRFLRVGTTGSLQPSFVKIGDLINVQAAVRDESTSTHYVPLEFPAIASLEFISSILLAAEKCKFSEEIHTGIVHCKSALYAREFGEGPRAQENTAYIKLLTQAGILASEMETATLFIQSQLYNHELQQLGDLPQHRVLSGAILAVISTTPDTFELNPSADTATKHAIELALETVKTLATQEQVG